MESLEKVGRRRLTAQLDQGLHRSLPQLAPDLVDFWSNDYLGLARVGQPLPGTIEVGGSTGSRLLSGNREATEHIERSIAESHGFSAGLAFASGYDANLGLLSCLARRTDSLVLDGLAHASLIDGAQLSQGRRLSFRHNDVADLQTKLAAVASSRPDGSAIVVVEATYSMDGDHTPLADIVDVCAAYDAGLIVDEAHSIGVVGSCGEGLVASLGLQASVDACVYTFGKALGGHGAVVAGDDWLREYLINFCRPFMYSTAPPPTHVAEMFARHSQMVNAADERSALDRNIDRFRRRVNESEHLALRPLPGVTPSGSPHPGLTVLPSSSPIQSVIVGSNETSVALEDLLQQSGFAVKAIKSPTVPVGAERIRVCLHSFNAESDVDELVVRLDAASVELDSVRGSP